MRASLGYGLFLALMVLGIVFLYHTTTRNAAAMLTEEDIVNRIAYIKDKRGICYATLAALPSLCNSGATFAPINRRLSATMSNGRPA